jgi:hypothetical protein
MKILALTLMAVITAEPVSAQKDPGRVIAIEGVTLVPLDSVRIVPDQTVLVRGGRIMAVGRSFRSAVRCCPAFPNAIDIG